MGDLVPLRRTPRIRTPRIFIDHGDTSGWTVCAVCGQDWLASPGWGLCLADTEPVCPTCGHTHACRLYDAVLYLRHALAATATEAVTDA